MRKDAKAETRPSPPDKAASYEIGEEEEADLERVAAEDVAHRERMVSERDGGDPRRDLG